MEKRGQWAQHRKQRVCAGIISWKIVFSFLFPRNPILNPKMVRPHLFCLLLCLVWLKLFWSLWPSCLPRTKELKSPFQALQKIYHTDGGLLRHLTSSPCFSSCGSEEVASILLFPMLPLLLSVAQACAWHCRDVKRKELPALSAASPSSTLSTVAHMASCHTQPRAGHCWQVQPRTESTCSI